MGATQLGPNKTDHLPCRRDTCTNSHPASRALLPLGQGLPLSGDSGLALLGHQSPLPCSPIQDLPAHHNPRQLSEHFKLHRARSCMQVAEKEKWG